MKLDTEQLNAARQYLLGEGSEELIEFMAHQSVMRETARFQPSAEERAKELGWILATTGKRSLLGVFVSDSCREYLFWKERGKALPFDNTLPHLAPSTFEGKYVAEIGAGMGANLMSLAGTAKRLCGVEPVEAYAQLGAIFRTREGIADVEIRPGGAENLPFEDRELDLVLCVSAHQYFDIHPALTEIARVIKPGGELIIIGNTLGGYFNNSGMRIIKKRGRGLKSFLITLTNTVSYTYSGRRIIPSRGDFSTSRPIYPASAIMTRWIEAVGFEEAAPVNRVSKESCFYARRLEDPDSM